MNPTPAIFLILLLALLEAPIFLVIAGLSLVCLFAESGDWLALQTVVIEMNRMAAMPVLVALPLFTLTGVLLTETGAPRRVLRLVEALVGWLPGGLAMAALAACAFFTALTGASGVTIVAIGALLYPMLRERRYSETFSLGLLTTAGSLGLLFPPSLPVILYGLVAQVDIGRLFRAALLPGVILMLVLAAYAYLVRRRQLRRGEVPPDTAAGGWQPVLEALKAGIWEWPIAILIVGGIYGGWVTIAEVSAVVLTYVIVVECLILKEVDLLRQLPGIMVAAAKLAGAIMLILAMALGFTGYLVDARIPDKILAALTALTDNRYLFLAGLNCFLLAAGCIMDIFSAIVIIVPIMVPVAVSYGIDPIHLGVIFLVNLEIGYSTPPVGINLFIASLRFDRPITLLYKASLPYLLLLLLVLLVVTYFPGVSGWLLN
jgi:tripartite ATP-independent transporter DctM subunit